MSAKPLQLKQQLGQYFTPPSLAGFAWELLGLFQSEGRTRRFESQGPILEPSIGEGVFIRTGMRNGPDDAPWVGFDIDPSLEGSWQALRQSHPNLHLVRANALLPHHVLETPFQLVIGNPPFGATGVEELESVFDRYEITRHPGKKKQLPIECFFIERSVQLCAEGGWIALIVPEGILANQRLQSVRDWLLRRATVRALVSLPSQTFRSERATAKTALLILEKKLTSESAFLLDAKHESDYAEILDDVATHLKTLRRPDTCMTVPQSELDGQRWDLKFWNPTQLETLHLLKNAFETVPLGNFIKHLTYGPIITGQTPRAHPGDVLILGQRNLHASGLNPHHGDRVAENSPYDPARSRPQKGDLLFARSGMGSLGKGRMAVLDRDLRANISCFVDLVRFSDLDPHFAWLFLASRFGQGQIQRLINGVATPNLSFNELRALLIPVLTLPQQVELARPYHEEVRPLHRRYVELDAANSEEKATAGHAAAHAMRQTLARFEVQLSACGLATQ